MLWLPPALRWCGPPHLGVHCVTDVYTAEVRHPLSWHNLMTDAPTVWDVDPIARYLHDRVVERLRNFLPVEQLLLRPLLKHLLAGGADLQ